MSKEHLENKKLAITLMRMVIVLAVIFAIIYLVNKVEAILEAQKEPEITNIMISEKLQAVGELSSAELVYNGLIRFSEGEIPILTKKEFSMTYCATVEAGFKLSEAEIATTETEVVITLPQVEVLDVSVDPNSVQIFDENKALFNWSDREDTIDAIKEAEEDVMENGNIPRLKERARRETEVLIKGLLQDSIGERVVVIDYKD